MFGFVNFRGEIAQIVIDPNRAASVYDLLEAATAEELEIVCSECTREIHTIARDHAGSSFLKKLLVKLNAMDLQVEITSLMLVITVNETQFLSTICDSRISCEAVLSFLNYCSFMKKDIGVIVATKIVEIISNQSDMCFLFENLAQRLDLLDIQPVLMNISDELLSIAQTKRGLDNITDLVVSIKDSMLLSMLDMLKPRLLDIAFDIKGNHVLQTIIILPSDACSSSHLVDLLGGNFIKLSKHPFANHILQCCFDKGSDRNVSFIHEKICSMIFPLITHPYGSFIVKKLITRLKIMNPQLFNQYSSEILRRESQFGRNPYGKHVLKSCKHLLQ